MTMETIRDIANLFVIPACYLLWNIQGRLSHIEGQLGLRGKTDGA